MEPLSRTDIDNLLILINKAPLTGQEAITVALLQQKLIALQKTVKSEKVEKPDEKPREQKAK